MPELSLHNINQISDDVRKQEISFSHLADELIDHLCCDVEFEMKKGLSFSEAYHMVNEKIGYRRLKEIQEETLYAVDTKYRKMKNTMKISGIVGTIMFGFAALFKIMHWPLAGILMVLGALTLAFVFMPSALTVLWKETHSGKRLFLFVSAFLAGALFILGAAFKVQHWQASGFLLSLGGLIGIIFFLPALVVSKLKDNENRSKRAVYILAAAGLLCYILGILFKIQHWPLSSILLMAGLAITFFVVFPFYTRASWKEDSTVSGKFIYMVVGSLAIGIPTLLISLNVQRNYEGGFYMHQGEQQAMYNYKFTNSQTFISNCKDSVVAPVLAEISSKTNDLLEAINDLEAEMIAESEGKPGMPAVITRQIKQTESGPEIQFGNLRSPFHTAPFLDFLLEGSASRTELNIALKEYSDYLSGLISGGDFDKYEKLLDPSVYLPAIDPAKQRVSLMSGLHMLELLKNSILTVESQALRAVSKR